MRDLIATAFVSLDGVVEAPGGEPGHRSSGWTFKAVPPVPEAFEMKEAEQAQAGALLLGRISYQGFAPVWPSMEDFARYNTLPKYVVSTTLTNDDLVDNWGEQHLLRTLEDVAALKATPGGPLLVHGSATLVRNLTDAGLVDRFNLLVFPLLLGAGKRYFSEADKDYQKLELVEQSSYSNGVQKLVYNVLH